MIEIITSKEFINTFAGGAGSISITAFLWLIIYYGKKYLTKRTAFDIFSRNILQTREDINRIIHNISDRIEIARTTQNACINLDIQSQQAYDEFIKNLQKRLY